MAVSYPLGQGVLLQHMKPKLYASATVPGGQGGAISLGTDVGDTLGFNVGTALATTAGDALGFNVGFSAGSHPDRSPLRT